MRCSLAEALGRLFPVSKDVCPHVILNVLDIVQKEMSGLGGEEIEKRDTCGQSKRNKIVIR
jgi:hypothetical protein